LPGIAETFETELRSTTNCN